MQVRWAARGEAPKVYALVRALAQAEGSEPPRPSAFSRVWAWGFRDAPPFRYAVAEDAKAIVGCMSLHQHVSTWRALPAVSVEDLYVLPERRGQGIGTALLAFAEEHARRLGAARLELHVLEANDGARRLYQRAGWHGTPYVWMQKDVAAEAGRAPPPPSPRAEAQRKRGQGARQRAKGLRRPGGWGPPR